MIVRPVNNNEREIFNQVATHPLQSWEWGDFKKSQGATVERIGFFEDNRLIKGIQVFFHPLPLLGGTVGYFPKSYMPDDDQLATLKQLAIKHRAVAIKMEPNVFQPVKPGENTSGFADIEKFLIEHNCRPGKPLFTRYTFVLSLEPTIEKLLAQCKAKTRYNIHLAERKGVSIVENSTEQGLATHLEILEETTTRQKFYAHTPKYFQDMWAQLAPIGMMRIFEARYQDQVLTSWIVFIYGNKLYYPYGASRSIHRDLMASNLMMWKMIEFGKHLNLKHFDMWGSLGPDPDPHDPWYGFHRFKLGYGGTLCEFLGTYDFVSMPLNYSIYRAAENIRWKFLRFKAGLRKAPPEPKEEKTVEATAEIAA